MTILSQSTLWDLPHLNVAPSHEPAGEPEVGIRPITYEGEPYHGRPSLVFAYVGVPTPPVAAAPDETTLPGMVLVHGGGGTAFREWVAMWNARGYAAIAMDLGGRAAGREPLADGGPPQTHETKFADPAANWADHWVSHSVANVIRAHSLLRSLPGVDPDRIGLTGISWGGYLTCLVAALDPRFRCAVPVYGCGFLQENSGWVDRESFKALDEAGRHAWHERCDPSQYVGRATMPILFSSRPTDEAYRFDSLRKTYSLVSPSLLHLAVRVELGHSHPNGWSPPGIARFADYTLRGAPGLPRAAVPELSTDRRSVTTTYTAQRPIVKSSLAHTCDTGPWQERTWRHAPADDSADLHAEVPAGATACFFTLTDDLGGYASSPHMVLDEITSPRS